MLGRAGFLLKNPTGTTMSWGEAITVEAVSGGGYYPTLAVLDDTYAIAVWSHWSDYSTWGAVIQRAGNILTAGTPVQISPNEFREISAAGMNTTTAIISYRVGNVATAQVLTRSGMTLSAGTPAQTNGGGPGSNSAIYKLDADRAVVSYQAANVFVNVVQLNGTGLLVGTPATAPVTPVEIRTAVAPIGTSGGVVFYNTSINNLYVTPFTIVGLNATMGSETVVDNAPYAGTLIAMPLSGSKAMLGWRRSANGSAFQQRGLIVSVTGLSLSLGTFQVYVEDNALSTAFARLSSSYSMFMSTSNADVSMQAEHQVASGDTIVKGAHKTFSPAPDGGYLDAEGMDSTSAIVLYADFYSPYYIKARMVNCADQIPAAPATPTAAPATSLQSDRFTANWGTADFALSFVLEVATDSGFSNIVYSQNVGLVYNQVVVYGTPLTTNYFYRVHSVGQYGTSDNSNTIALYTAPATPVATAATNDAGTSFQANWNAVSGATKYYLDVATDSGFTTFVSGYQNKDVGTNLNDSVTGVDTSANEYFYRVRAWNPAGTSNNSNTISIGTPAVVQYNYMRLYVTATPMNNATIMQEMSVAETVSGTPVTPTSSDQSPSYASALAERLYDGNVSTFWNTSAAGPWWAVYYWATARTIKEIKLTSLTGYSSYMPQDFLIQGSNNGIGWTTLGSWTGQTFGDTETKTFTIT
jgi:hypothetical protein